MISRAASSGIAMAEQYVFNDSYSYNPIVSPSEMTPLVSGSGEYRDRLISESTASVLSWEKVGSGDDECDNEVRCIYY